MNHSVYRSRENFSILRIGLVGVLLIGALVQVMGRTSLVDTLTLILPFVAAYWVVARTGVFVNEAEVRVVNPLRTHVLDWDDVLGFELGPARFTRNDQGYVDTRSGRIPLFAIQSNNSLVRSRNLPERGTIDELNRILQEKRHPNAAPSGGS